MRFLYLGLILLSSMLFAQDYSDYIKTAEEITRKALNDQSGYRMLEELCSIGPRLTGSENYNRALLWAKARMENMGLDSVWLQPVMVPHWERGNIEEAVLTSGSIVKNLSVTALGGSIATPPEGISAEVLEVKSFEELELLKEKARGKIIFFSRPLEQGLLNTFAGYGGAVDQRSSGAMNAARYGGVAAIIRSVTTKYDNVPHTGSMNYSDTLPKIPGAALGYIDADYLSKMLKIDPQLKLTLKFNCRKLPDIKSYNLIGEIKGSQYPDEIILTGGHFDSWDVGCGAHDDGAGCLQSLEVLELFKKLNLNPKRTIRCVFFINEENGLKGALEYARYYDSIGTYHIAAIESDRGAFTPEGFDVESDSLTIKKISDWLPVLNRTGIEYVKNGGSGVDISKIQNIKARIGYVPDDQRYMDVHHSANDTFESVHPREFELGAAAITVLVYLLSEEGI